MLTFPRGSTTRLAINNHPVFGPLMTTLFFSLVVAIALAGCTQGSTKPSESEALKNLGSMTLGEAEAYPWSNRGGFWGMLLQGAFDEKGLMQSESVILTPEECWLIITVTSMAEERGDSAAVREKTINELIEMGKRFAPRGPNGEPIDRNTPTPPLLPK
jgi:hypothetical protein